MGATAFMGIEVVVGSRVIKDYGTGSYARLEYSNDRGVSFHGANTKIFGLNANRFQGKLTLNLLPGSEDDQYFTEFMLDQDSGKKLGFLPTTTFKRNMTDEDNKDITDEYTLKFITIDKALAGAIEVGAEIGESAVVNQWIFDCRVEPKRPKKR